jgi:vacuolar-type H+-ATPase subunit F/Vma7
MSLAEADPNATRMIFMGNSSLADGFRLIGFEIWADPEVEQMDEVLHEIRNHGQKAFVVLERYLSQSSSKILESLRNEGGRVVITQIPPLHDATCFHCDIDRKVQAMLGQAAGQGDGAREGEE